MKPPVSQYKYITNAFAVHLYALGQINEYRRPGEKPYVYKPISDPEPEGGDDDFGMYVHRHGDNMMLIYYLVITHSTGDTPAVSRQKEQEARETAKKRDPRVKLGMYDVVNMLVLRY